MVGQEHIYNCAEGSRVAVKLAVRVSILGLELVFRVRVSILVFLLEVFLSCFSFTLGRNLVHSRHQRGFLRKLDCMNSQTQLLMIKLQLGSTSSTSMRHGVAIVKVLLRFGGFLPPGLRTTTKSPFPR